MSRPEYEISYTKGAERLVDRVTGLLAAVRHRTHLQYNGCRGVEIAPVTDRVETVIDLGTDNRDAAGRFVKTVTLTYYTHAWRRVVRHLPVERLRTGTMGPVVARGAERGAIWGVEVTDSEGHNVTGEIPCLARFA